MNLIWKIIAKPLSNPRCDSIRAIVAQFVSLLEGACGGGVWVVWWVAGAGKAWVVGWLWDDRRKSKDSQKFFCLSFWSHGCACNLPEAPPAGYSLLTQMPPLQILLLLSLARP